MNLLHAELMRLLKRIPHWIFLGILILVALIVTLGTGGSDPQEFWIVDSARSYLGMMPLVLGIGFMFFIFFDDRKAENFSVAVGSGFSRTKIVFVKWGEVWILALIDFMLLFLFSLLAVVIRYPAVSGSSVAALFLTALHGVLKSTAYITVTMMLHFTVSNSVLPTMLFLALASGALNSLFSLIFSMKTLSRYPVDEYTLTFFIKSLNNSIRSGEVKISNFIGIAVYMAIALTVTILLFRKRDLEA